MAESLKEKKIKTKVEVLSYYSLHSIPECKICGRTELIKLEIDHIKDGGNKHREQLNNHGGYAFYRWLQINGYPSGYQTLCRQCNEHKSFLTGTRKGKAGRRGYEILQYDKNNNLINSYNSLREAARENNLLHQTISYAIKNKSNNKAYGYVWKLKENEKCQNLVKL